ncbi:hypothetical protein ACOSP6_15855 [Tenacibaculum sp. MEBiC06402]|uniref:hypothetical protein n=1 Tax=unclassified Tenacibaculum TaxID=2635139 RepID=UPI003B9BAE54
MKKTILILLCAIPSVIFSQISSNIISQNDFDNIKINNSTLKTIKGSKGELNLIKNIFGENFTDKNIDPDGEFKNYEYNGFSIGFSGLTGTLDNHELSGFEITNSNWSVTIKGNVVKVGNHKNNLGDVILNNQKDGGKSIVYQFCNGCNSFISFHLDNNGYILKIVYVEQT